MATMEANVFPITNLAELSSDYKLYRVKGLTPEQKEYYQNLQYLRRRLGFLLRSPMAVIEREGFPYLAVSVDAGEPPDPFSLIRTAVRFERDPNVFTLDYCIRSPENDKLCLGFLQFVLQTPLYSNPALWQSGPGRPFFEKASSTLGKDMRQYQGFSVRPVVTPDGGLGLCVDVTSRTVSAKPLPTHISRDEFPEWRGKHCIYHYGHRWYEIQVSELSDFNVSEHLIPEGREWISLLDFVIRESDKPIPPELAQVPHDAAVVLYQNNRRETRSAPTPLCYPVYGTDEGEVGGRHRSTILPPHLRRKSILDYVHHYLERLRFGTMYIRVSSNPISVPPRMFSVPDYEFGNSTVLSVRGTKGAQHVSLDRLGDARLALLKDKEAGFYCKDPLDRQYFILPQSVFESYGTQFLQDLRHTVDGLFPQEGGYDPIVVTYNDRGPRTFPWQGDAVLKAVEAKCDLPGYGVAMIHHTVDRGLREEDQLAAMVVREFRRRFDICVSVIHTEVGQQCYGLVTSKGGKSSYVPRKDKRGQLEGYLRNVALNHVLLTNQRWPFILATPLSADITIGIDVKLNTVGLVVVGGNGGEIRSLLKTSRQKECLLADQLRAYLIEIIRQEAGARTKPIRTIVVHRDGRTHQSEIEGARRAIERLREEGTVAQDATLTILEIPKTSPVRLRLFDVSEREGRKWIENPQVGCYYIVNETEGYLCSTGRAFPRPGTVQPLHVRRVEGLLPLERCLEDIYYLTTLAWTRPEDCTRDPITIKINDRFLSEEATPYDADALDFGTTLEEEDDE